MTFHPGRILRFMIFILIISILIAPMALGDTPEAKETDKFDLYSPFSVNITKRIILDGAEHNGEYRAIFHHEKRAFRLEGMITPPDKDQSYDIIVISDEESVGVTIITAEKTIDRRFANEEFERYDENFSIFKGLSPTTYKNLLQRSRYRRDVTSEYPVDEDIKVFRINTALSRRQPAISHLLIQISERTGLPVKVIGRDNDDREIITILYSDYQSIHMDDMEIFDVSPNHPQPAIQPVEE